MSNNTQPPFAQGQRVICINDKQLGGPPQVTFCIKKGEVYTVSRCIHNHWGWWVELTDFLHQGYWPEQFAPIESSYANVSKELATQPIEERLDVPKINEPVLS